MGNEEVIHVYDPRLRLALISLALWGVVLVGILLVLSFNVPLVVSGCGRLCSPAYPIGWTALIGTFATFLAAKQGKRVAFYSGRVMVTDILGRRTEIPFDQLDLEPPAGQSMKKFGIRRSAGEGGLSRSGWLNVSNPIIAKLDNNYLFDWLIRKIEKP